MMCSHRSTIAVVGTGMVGSSFAYAALIRGLAAEIILIDASEEREQGEVMDLAHGLIGSETGNVRGGQLKDCQQADIIVITAGAAQKLGETRLDLVNKNVGVLKSIIKGMGDLRPSAIVVIVSNPVDILTYMARKLIRLPENQIIGTGTSLDTARFRYLISRELNVNLHNVHGYILGEHGDSEVPAWSLTTVGGVKATELLSAAQQKKIFEGTKNAAYQIIQRKQATYYGIGITIVGLVERIVYDQKSIVPVSVNPKGLYGIRDISIGITAVLGVQGIKKVWELPLSVSEKKKLVQSAAALKAILKKIKL